MTFGELFAGIGGFSLGLERAGMTCKWQVEIDPYATAVLKKHWPDVPKHDDVRTFPPAHTHTHTHTHTHDYSVDLICGGFPCQDISYAGKGAGLAGERSGLWHEFARVIRAVQPRWVVIENVPALTARGLGTVLGDLAEIGFDAEWHCIPASAVGAPHRRERIWILGNARGKPVSGGISASVAQRGEASAPASPVDTGDAGCGGTCPRSSNVAVYCIPARANGETNASRPNADGFGSHRERIDIVRGAELRHEQERVARSLGEDVADAESISGRSRLCQDHTHQDGHQPCNSCGDVSNANRAGRQQQRRPESAPAEQRAAQCGGWWESEPDVGRVAHGVPSRVDRLRCLGNAVVPQVVEVIGRAILAAEARMTA